HSPLRFALAVALAVAALLPPLAPARAASVPEGPPAHSLWRQAGADFAAWELAGVRVESASLTLDPAGPSEGADPYGPGGYRGGNYSNGGAFWVGDALSPVHEVPGGFDELIPSWNAETPDGTWLEVRVAVRVDGDWTKEYVLGIWASGEDTIRRHSV